MGRTMRSMGTVLLCGIMMIGGAMVAEAGEAGDGGTLAFSSMRDDNEDIYVIKADGTGLRRVTVHETRESEPCWAPDARRIAYQSRRPHWAIYTSDIDGNDERQITDHLSWSPNWSPDGKWILYSTGASIRRVSALGEDGTTLTSDGNSGRPSWAPDGRSIAFHSNRSGNLDVYLMPASGEGSHTVAAAPGKDFHASWSPDGRRLVFASDRDGDFEIFTIGVEESDLEKLTDNSVEDMLPAWSPDGALIAFVSQRDGNREIYVMRPDGSSPRRLTDHPGDDMFPAWKPLLVGLED